MPVLLPRLPSERAACPPSGSGGRCDWSWRRWRGRAERSLARRWGSKWSQRSCRRWSLAPCLHIWKRRKVLKSGSSEQRRRPPQRPSKHMTHPRATSETSHTHFYCLKSIHSSIASFFSFFSPQSSCLMHWTDFRVNRHRSLKGCPPHSGCMHHHQDGADS